jgi:hypothetical protein
MTGIPHRGYRPWATRMSGHFAVEADRQVVGIGVRVPGGFQFFSSNEDYRELEGTVFRRARAMIHRAAQLSRRKRRDSRRAAVPALHGSE